MNEGGRRIRTVGAVFGIILAIFVGRLWELQLTKWVVYAREAVGNSTQVMRQEPPRGSIFDRNGEVLAENRACWQVGVDPTYFPKDDYEASRVVVRLAGILGAKAPQLRDAIEEAIKASAGQVVPLATVKEATDLDLRAVAKIEEHRFDLPGIVVLETLQRHYPHGKLAAHVLGYARSITAEQYEQYKDIPAPAVEKPGRGGTELLSDKLYSNNSVTGQAGVEALCELDYTMEPPFPILTGVPGRIVREVDVRGRPVRIISFRPPQPGASVYLTIDLRVQQAAEQALAEMLRRHGRSGCVVAVDVNTGEILAMCSLPEYDPNKWVRGLKPEEWRRLHTDPRSPLLNGAIGGAYPPGSTFKIVSALAALEATNIKPTTTFVCGGRISVGRPPTIFRCWRRSGHGPVDFWRGMAESCDVYFYELVRKARLRADAIAYWARELGFGKSTKCGLPGEIDGLVPTPEWKLTVLHERWRLGDTLNMVIGQGYLTVTPLQMAMATAAIANGGRLYKPLIVRKIHWPQWAGREPTLAHPELVRTINAKPEHLAMIRRAMRLAVASAQGTGRALADFPVPVAGKTGSAEHHPAKPTHAWFTCFAPADNPRYAVTVFVNSGGHGGSVAAPVARKVLAALFGIADTAKPTKLVSD